jgi:plastocyanin
MNDMKTQDPAVTSIEAWLRIARVAAIVVVVWAALLQLTVGVLIPPVLAVGIVFAALVPFLGRERRLAGLVGAVLGVAAVGGNVPSLLEELSHPSSAQAFIFTLVAASASAVLMLAGTAAFFHRSANPAPVMWLWAGLVVAGSLGSLLAARAVDSTPPADGDVIVVAKANDFSPDPMVVLPGRIGVWIDNRDGARHTFTAPELGVDVEITGLKSQRVEFDAAPGRYIVFCKVVGHEDMTAILAVG